MFDQKPTNFNEPPVNLPGSNLTPKAEPEDILADVEIQPRNSTSAAVPNLSTANVAEALPPAQPIAPRAQVTEPVVTHYKKIFLAIFLIILGVGALGAAGWYGYQQFLAPQNIDNTLNQLNNEPVANLNQNLNTLIPENQNLNLAPVVQSTDSDSDGLTDEEEVLYGTNINSVDTDSDGLTDRDEVKVFKTDPLNLDTDGDTYKDGDEVISGYNPKGAGKIFKIE